MKVYLAGPMMGCTDEEMTSWRNYAKIWLPLIKWLDPTRRDYRDIHTTISPYVIVNDDLADIAASDMVLVNADKPSWGTAMEVVYARVLHKIVVAFCSGEVSPWLKHHSTVIKPTLEEAIQWIENFHKSLLELPDA